MTDPFENYSTILRMRQSRFERESKPNSTETKVLDSKPTMDTTTESIGYENVDNYPTILRIREGRDPTNSLGPSESFNTMVTGCRYGFEAPRTPYYTEGSETQSEAEASETTGSGSGSDTESSTGSTVEALPTMMIPPGRMQPNLAIPSAMSLEDEKKRNYLSEDPIQEISITESNILESFSMQSYSMRSKGSRDTFGDDEEEVEDKRVREETPKKPSSPLEASIMAMDAYYKRVTAPRIIPSVDPRVEEMKQLMLALWKKDQSSATLLFSLSWHLTRRYRSMGTGPAHSETNNEKRKTEQQPSEKIQLPLADLHLWRLFQRFCTSQGELVVPLYLCPPAVDEFLISDWSNEIEGMESDEISDSDLLMEGLLTVDRVMSLEDLDDDEIFKFRKCISDEFRQGLERSDDGIPSLSDDDDLFKFRGFIEQNHYVFETGSSSMANSNLDSSQILTPLAPYGPFSKLEKIIEEVSNGETESTATSNQEETLFSSGDDADVVEASQHECDTKSKDHMSLEESLDAIIMISTKSGVGSVAESNEGTLDYSQENTENSGDWGNSYCSSAGKSNMECMPIGAAFDIAVQGIRSLESEANSAREGSRRGAREGPWKAAREGSIRSRGDYSIASEQTYLPEDCCSEKLVDRFLYTLEIALCLR